MNKKILYAVIAIVVVIILVIAVLELIPSSAVASMTVSVSSSTASVGQNLTFAAFITGGTPSKVMFSFGDGVTGSATHLTGNEYTIAHSYSSAGKYLVTANATVNGKIVNNLQGIFEVSVTPSAASPTIASEITVPSIITPSQIISPGTTVSLTASTLQPPTATNWTIGYYIWSFGDGATHTNYTVFNSSSGSFMAGSISHLYSTEGIYVITLGVITFNATNYVPTTYISNGINYTYYPLSDLTSILTSSGNYYNNTYVCTLVVNSTAKLLSSTIPITNPDQITLTQVAPGGPFSFDPAITPGTIDLLPVVNVYECLIEDNGSSSTTFVPVIAKAVPTISNGEESASGLNFTFYIRSGLKFSNGDPVTVWDAYTSFVRLLLFTLGVPGTDGYLLAMDLLPGGGYAPGLFTNATSLYDNITHCVTFNNVSQSITFNLITPDPIFLQRIASYWTGNIMDYNWLVAHGAGITFTPAGFLAYTAYGNETDYNSYVRYNCMGSGPYMVKNYLIGQSIVLVPNPYFTILPGVCGYNHTVNNTVYIQWEKDPDTALLIAESGQTDIVYGLPNSDYPIISHLQSEGKMNIYTFPSLSVWFYEYNAAINTTMLTTLGPGYHIPAYYFANEDVRKAFTYAYNYTNYIDNILGNNIYGANFGFQFFGGIPEGMPGFMNNTQLRQAGTMVPTYDLTLAKQYMEQSGLYNQTINIPIIVWAGDPIDFAGAQDWATTLNSIDPNIQASAMYLQYTSVIGYSIPNANPMPICLSGWMPPWNYPSATMLFFFQEGNYFAPLDGVSYATFESLGYTQEESQWQTMQNYINNTTYTTNETLSLKNYDLANEIAINMSLYVDLYQETGMLMYATDLKGAQYEENPTVAAGGVSLFFYLTKV